MKARVGRGTCFSDIRPVASNFTLLAGWTPCICVKPQRQKLTLYPELTGQHHFRLLGAAVASATRQPGRPGAVKTPVRRHLRSGHCNRANGSAAERGMQGTVGHGLGAAWRSGVPRKSSAFLTG